PMLEFTSMKFIRCHIRWLTVVLILCALTVTQSGLIAAAPQSSEESSKPLYQPPKKLAPRARVGGDVRGTDGPDPEVILLVRDHVGYTMQHTPAVNWFLSKSTGHQVRFTLRDDRSTRSFKEITIPTPREPGIYTINLKELGLVLEPNVQYRLFVSVI